MRALVLALALIFSFASVAAANCNCGLTEKQVKKIQEIYLKQKDNKHSRFNQCLRAGSSKDSCKAELVTNYLMGI